jgi:mono/diheme cytochrome c family protein
MTMRAAGSCVAGLVAGLTLAIVAEATPAQAPAARTARDGVFSQAQVERGRTAYNAQCARCHGETLGGGETSPALVDERFFATWTGRSVGELVERTRLTMPSDGPGRIPRRRCIDIAAFVLSANGFPAGDQEFPTDLDALNRITITRAQ